MVELKILLVDDEREFLESTARTLSRRHFIVDEAAGGVDALKYLKSQTPDIVILDLKMAEMDGIATLRRIRAEHGDLPVIILTGHGDFESALSGIKLEIVDFLQKPVDIDLLAHRIRMLIERKWSTPLKEKTVAELMVPLKHYNWVYEDQSIGEALRELRNGRTNYKPGIVRDAGHRSILVKDRDEKVLGLLRMVDVLGMAIPEWLRDTQYRTFYTGMFLAQCKVFAEGRIGDFFADQEPVVIDEYTPLIEATVLMAENRLINLPVVRNGEIVGILRDKDLIHEILCATLGE